MENRLSVEITDDGIGGVPDDAPLPALRDRVVSVGGTLSVRSAAADGTTILAAVALRESVMEHRPELPVIDVRMPPSMESDGAEAAAALQARHPDLGLMVLSQHIELRHVLPLIGTPAFGYLLKDRVLDLADFITAAERVAGAVARWTPTSSAPSSGRGRHRLSRG